MATLGPDYPAKSFAAFSNLITSCPIEIDVGEMEAWTTLGGIHKDSGNPSDNEIAECIAESQRNVVDLFWNWVAIKGSSQFDVVGQYTHSIADLVYSAPPLPEDPENPPDPPEPSQFVEPYERVCPRYNYQRVVYVPDGQLVLNAMIATLLNTSNFVKMYLNDRFIGYGLHQLSSVDPAFSAIGTSAGSGSGAFSCISIGGYLANPAIGWDRPTDSYTLARTGLKNLTTNKEYPVLVEAVARGSEDSSTNIQDGVFTASANTETGGSQILVAESQIDGIVSWQYGTGTGGFSGVEVG